MHYVEKLSPIISEKFSDKEIPELVFPNGLVKHNVTFHYGCLMNTMFADINLDTIEVLKEMGCKIITPKIRFAVDL